MQHCNTIRDIVYIGLLPKLYRGKNVKTSKIIVFAAVLVGILFWVADATIDYFVSHPGPFVGHLLTDIPPHDIYIRILAFVLFTLFGIVIATLSARHKQANEALRKSEALHRTLVENIPQKIFMKARDFTWISINENFARDLGVRPEDVVGKVDSDFFPKELADKYRADDKRIMEEGITDELVEQYVQDGKKVWVETVKDAHQE